MNNTPLLIFNPVANQGGAQKILPKVQELFKSFNFEYDLMLTDYHGHALDLAKKEAESGRVMIIAAGGDGTMNEVINGLMRADLQGKKLPILGVLPVGRGNDFSFGMSLPAEVEKNIRAIVEGKTRKIDIGIVVGGDFPEGRYFGNGVGLGFDTVVGFEAAKVRWAKGAASYIVGLIKTISLYNTAPTYEIILDDETITQPSLLVSIMNGKRMGGLFHMAPAGDPGDGLFNLCLASQVPQMKILPLASRFISGNQEGHSAIRMLTSAKVKVKAINGNIPAHADGETICVAGKELTIELIPHAIEIITTEDGAD